MLSALINFSLFYFGCLASWGLQKQLALPSVIAATSVGLIASIVPVPKKLNDKNVASLVYSGTFAGMSSSSILQTHQDVLILSLMGALVFYFTSPFAKSYGGRLGTIAFISSLFYFLLRRLLW
jgi:hypothetical protein